MARFILEKRISSCVVGTELLKKLEEYLLNNIPEMTSVSKEEIRDKYSLLITDNFGTENLCSISEYPGPIFRDSTNRVSLGFDLYSPKIICVSVKFSTERFGSCINIDCESQNARGFVVAIYDGIKRILEPYHNLNKLLYPHPTVDGFLWGIAIAIAWVPVLLLIAELTDRFSPYFYILTNFPLFVILFSYVIRKMKPYTSFESNRYFKIKKWTGWFFYGLLSFIIFGTLLFSLRKRLFGF